MTWLTDTSFGNWESFKMEILCLGILIQSLRGKCQIRERNQPLPLRKTVNVWSVLLVDAK